MTVTFVKSEFGKFVKVKLENKKKPKAMSSRVNIDDSWKIGIVRIYDDDRGTGFVTELTSGPTFGLDFFVNENAIKQYMPTHRHKRRLLTGEYVHFLVDSRHTPTGTQRQRIGKIRGLFGGPLMFEQGEVVFTSYSRINQTMYPQASPSHNNATIPCPTEVQVLLNQGVPILDESTPTQNIGSISSEVVDSVVVAPPDSVDGM